VGERLEIPATAAEAGVLDGELVPGRVNEQVLEREAHVLAELRRRLGDYVDGVVEVDPADRRLVETAEALRGLLEALYGQRITFVGEQGRPSSGSLLEAGARERIKQRANAVVASGERSIAVGLNSGVASSGDNAQITR